jgi:hypothetical protein
VNRIRLHVLIGCALLASAPASAGLFEDLYRGLDILATPSGSPVFAGPGGGLQNGSRLGRLRIVPNRFGDGYRLELDRRFGVDSFNRPEVFDFGAFELTLNGTISNTTQVTRRGFLIFSTQNSAGTLGYTLAGKSGAQDFTLTGTLDLRQSFEINRFGFYEFRLDATNAQSRLAFDGLAVGGDRNTNFDIGPINIKGNIFYDGLLAVLSGLGVDTSGLASVFPKSPIDTIGEQLREGVEKEAARIAAESVTFWPDAAPAQSALADGSAFGVTRGSDLSQNASGSAPNANQAPEPGTAALLSLGLLALGLRRR